MAVGLGFAHLFECPCLYAFIPFPCCSNRQNMCGVRGICGRISESSQSLFSLRVYKVQGDKTSAMDTLLCGISSAQPRSGSSLWRPSPVGPSRGW